MLTERYVKYFAPLIQEFVSEIDVLPCPDISDMPEPFLPLFGAKSKSKATHYWFDGAGNPLQIKDVSNLFTTASYNSLGYRSTVTDPETKRNETQNIVKNYSKKPRKRICLRGSIT